MSGNEDYLDSLLKMASQDVAPDSAISRVSELTKQVEEEKAAEAEMAVETEMAAETEVVAPEENVEQVEEPAVEEGVVEESVIVEPVIEEPVIEEPVIEEPVIDESVAEILEPDVSDISDESSSDSTDIDALLKSLSEDAEAPVDAEVPVDTEAITDFEIPSDAESMSEADIDSLLASLEDISEPVSEEAVSEEPVIEEPVVEAPIIEEPVIEDTPANNEEPASDSYLEGLLNDLDAAMEEPAAEAEAPAEDNPSAMMSADDIAAMFAAANGEEEPAAETEEPATKEVPVAEESAAEEEPVVEAEAPAEDNPSAMMSADDIAAMFAAANAEEEPAAEAEEPATEEVPVAEESAAEEEPVVEAKAPAEDNPSAMMSADDIAAMFAAANAEEEPAAEAEEPETEEAPVVEELVVEEEPVAEAEAPAVEEESTEADEKSEVEAFEELAEALHENAPDNPLSEEDLDALLASVSEPETASDENIEENAQEVSGEGVEEDSSLDLDALLSGIQAEDEAELDAPEMENTHDVIPGSDESLSDLSQDDIEKLLNNASNVDGEAPAVQGEIEIDADDLSSLESLGVFDKDTALPDELTAESEELSEISSLLKTADNNEYSLNEEDDLMNLLTLESKRQAEEEEIKNRAAVAAEVDQTADDEPKGKKGKKDKKKKQAKTEGEEDSEEPKKQGVLAKLLAFLTASDEDEEGAANSDVSEADPGFEGVASDENKEILDEIDKEDGKKGKKKGKKDKKAKKADKEGGDDGDDEEGDSKGKKKKAKKEKVKKEKPEKPEEPDNSKPLNKKNVRKIAVLAATILVLLILVIKLIPGMLSKQTARKAYYNQDYETTYNEFFGEKLSEGDQLLFERSEIMLKMQHKYNAFVAYNKMGMKEEALDQLLQAVDRYESWRLIAETLGCTEGFEQAYGMVVTALDVTYGMSVQDARDVLALPTDLEYSLKVKSIVDHTEYIDPNLPLPEPFVPEPEPTQNGYEDVLDEENF